MRYFFISYFYKINEGFGYGNIAVYYDCFPSLSDIEIRVRNNVDCDGITILNIQELNEVDWNNLLGESESE